MMARTMVVSLTDDVDGKPADETVTFGLDGVNYEIDLTSKNATTMRKAFDSYISSGRRVGGRAGRAARRPGARVRSSQETKAIREWAKASGYAVSERGRLSAEVLEAYNNAPSL